MISHLGKSALQNKYIDFAAISVLTFLILLFCRELLINGEVPFYRDLTNYFYPLRYSLYESYRGTELPLWDRHFAQGFPNFASFQSGAFYPPHFVFFVFPFFPSIRALFVFHFLVAAIGTYKLLRRWNYSWELALVGSLSFALGGVIVSLSNLLNHFQSAVWLPWLVLAFEYLLITPHWTHFLTFAVVAAMQLLAGSPEMFALSMSLALVDGIQMRDRDPGVSFCRIFGLALGANVLILCVIMAQFLPTTELVMESRRSQSIPAVEAFMWSFDPAALISLFFVDREVESKLAVGIIQFFTRRVPLFINCYLGMTSLFGIAFWCYCSNRREKIYLTGLVLSSLALALGDNALIYPFLFQHLPFFSAIRFPEKFFFLTYVFLIIITMRGLRMLLIDRGKEFKAAISILGLICIFWMAAYFTLMTHSEALAEFITANGNIPSQFQASATASVLTNLQRQAILSVALFVLLVLFKADKIRRLLFSILLVSLVFVDLASVQQAFLFSVHPNKVYAERPIIESSKAYLSRFFFYPSSHDLHPAFFTVRGQPTFEQAVALSFENYLPNVGVLDGIDYFQEIDALGRRPYKDFLTFANTLEFSRQLRLLRTFNVGYLVSFQPLPETGIRLIGHFPNYFSWLYQVEDTVPRAYVVNRTIVEKEPAKALVRLSLPEFDPLREVVLQDDIAIQPTNPLQALVNIQHYGNTSVTINATTNQKSVLVLTDSFYPGWKVFVDEKETKILKANHFYRAVVILPGQHFVEFKYEPMSFTLGLVISVFTVICLLIVSVIVFRKQRNKALITVPNPVKILEAQ
jgi:hypothetical protein